MKVAIPLAKNVLAPLGTTAAASAIDAEIQKKIHGSGTTTLIISNQEMNDIMKIVQALQYSNIFLKGVTKTIKNETQKKNKKEYVAWYFRSYFVKKFINRKGIVRAGSGNKKGKGIVRAGSGNKKGKGIVRAGSGNKKGKGIVRAGTGKQWDF